MKLRLPTNLSDTFLNTCPTVSPAGSGFSSTSASSPAAFLNAVRGLTSSGLSVYWARASSNSGTPTFFLADVQKIGTTVPAASALGRACNNSASETSPSLRYFSMRASSDSTMESTSWLRAAARSTGQPAGGLAGGDSTLTTPLRFGPGLMGALNRTQ